MSCPTPEPRLWVLFTALVCSLAACVGVPPTDPIEGLEDQVSPLLGPLPEQSRLASGMRLEDRGRRRGSQLGLTVEPLLAFELSESYSLLSRSRLDLVRRGSGGRRGSGQADGQLQQSFLLVPKGQSKAGLRWGYGVRFLVSDRDLEDLGGGPELSLETRRGPWLLGAGLGHTFDVDGHSGRTERSFLEPTVIYARGLWSHQLELPVTYSSHRHRWSAPLSLTSRRQVTWGGMPLLVGIGASYSLTGSHRGPEDLGIGFTLELPLTR